VPPTARSGVIDARNTRAGPTDEAEPTFTVDPGIGAVSPNPIKPGQTLTIMGADLASAVSASMGAVPMTISHATANEVDLVVPPDAVSGPVLLRLSSG